MNRGVLLDVDGTLVESNDAHARSWVEALEGVGVSLPVEQVRRLIGKGGDKLVWELAGIDADSPQGQAIRRRRLEIFRTFYVPMLAPTPGARELVLALRYRGFTLVVATSASREELEMLLIAAGVRDLLDEWVTESDVDRSKPDPDVLHAAIERTRLPPAEVVFIGDTPYDVEAGQRAGVDVIALRCGGWDDDALRGAIAIYDDPADLLAHLDESPLMAGEKEESSSERIHSL